MCAFLFGSNFSSELPEVPEQHLHLGLLYSYWITAGRLLPQNVVMIYKEQVRAKVSIVFLR